MIWQDDEVAESALACHCAEKGMGYGGFAAFAHKKAAQQR